MQNYQVGKVKHEQTQSERIYEFTIDDLDGISA